MLWSRIFFSILVQTANIYNLTTALVQTEFDFGPFNRNTSYPSGFPVTSKSSMSAHAAMTKSSISHSLTPFSIRKYPFSPHQLPHEFDAIYEHRQYNISKYNNLKEQCVCVCGGGGCYDLLVP